MPRRPPLALLVDRDGDERKSFADLLKISSCEIEATEDGREALALAIAHRPDVVVIDTQLPGINGFELCSLLRADALTRNTSIVVVTSVGSEREIERARDSGADTVLVKPIAAEALLLEMQRLLDQSAALRERSRELSVNAQRNVARSERIVERSHALANRRPIMSRTMRRHDTVDPPVAPPSLVCPSCDQPLRYQRSHVGGVNAHNLEQWDYYECQGGCGAFQYRQRTRKLRRVS